MNFWDSWPVDSVSIFPSNGNWFAPSDVSWVSGGGGTSGGGGASGTWPVSVVVPAHEDFNGCSGVSLGQVLGVKSSISFDGALTVSITFVGRVFETYDERLISLDEGNWPVQTIVSQYYREVSCPGLKFPETFRIELPSGLLFYKSVGFRSWWGGGSHLPEKSFEWWRVKKHNSDYSGWFPCINDFLSALPSDPPRLPEDYPYVLVSEKKEFGLADMIFRFRPAFSSAAIIPAIRAFGWGFGWGGGLTRSSFRRSSVRLNAVESLLDNFRSNYD